MKEAIEILKERMENEYRIAENYRKNGDFGFEKLHNQNASALQFAIAVLTGEV